MNDSMIYTLNNDTAKILDLKTLNVNNKIIIDTNNFKDLKMLDENRIISIGRKGEISIYDLNNGSLIKRREKLLGNLDKSLDSIEYGNAFISPDGALILIYYTDISTGDFPGIQNNKINNYVEIYDINKDTTLSLFTNYSYYPQFVKFNINSTVSLINGNYDNYFSKSEKINNILWYYSFKYEQNNNIEKLTSFYENLQIRDK